MTTRDQVLKEIDKLPADHLREVLDFIRAIRRRIKAQQKVPTHDLGGQFDRSDLRKLANE
ncbi:MAG: hypothetical protein GX442_00535 [Candidatus Riflebacteria bacterium]|nr:hypothetical protein [Candidatus Riflebacteria bacterium]